jgi:hypothetical protein
MPDLHWEIRGNTVNTLDLRNGRRFPSAHTTETLVIQALEGIKVEV